MLFPMIIISKKVSDFRSKMLVSKYDCNLCHKKITHPKQHNLAVHSELKPYKCKYCDKSFNDPSALRRHHKIHEANNVKSFACSICDKKFTTREYLRLHGRSHQEETFQCKLCFSKIKGKFKFRDHVKAHSTSIKCSLCDKTFQRRCKLNIHLKGFHNQGVRISCTECSSTFKTKGYLQKHMKYLHSKKDLEKLVCDICNKQFSQDGPLIIHKRIHRGERIDCSLCDSTFSNKTGLKGHLATAHHIGIHDKNFACKVCNRTFSRKFTLEGHELTHIGLKQFHCNFCDYKAILKGTLREHLKTCKERTGDTLIQ